MDRHDVSKDVTAEIVAHIHQEDLKVQHMFGCRGLTYWFDEIRKTAFCLIEAPDKNAIVEMHRLAHGEVPHQIIEVDTHIVESFLGRIEDPEKAIDTKLNIINDPAFRTIMTATIEPDFLKRYESLSYNLKMEHFFKQLAISFNSFDGNIVRQNSNEFLVSFQSVTKAVLCAIAIQEKVQTSITQYSIDSVKLNIGLHAGVPVTEKKSIFEDTIKLTERMLYVTCADVVISTQVMQLYESENFSSDVKKNQIYVLTHSEEIFLNNFMEFIENEWQKTDLKVEDFEKNLGVSKSKLYRQTIQLTGKAPNTFLVNYRLQKSLHHLQTQKTNISEVAFDCGFNSPSYFAKCFRKKYGVTPSDINISNYS